MSLKSIEMQVALPRTVDAGKISEQIQQRGQIISAQANEEMQKKIERDSQSVNELAQKDHLSLKDQESDQQNQSRKHYEDPKRKNETKAKHPYKGKTIDYSG